MTGECRRGGLDLVINFRSMSIVMTKQQSDDEDVFVICYVGKKERSSGTVFAGIQNGLAFDILLEAGLQYTASNKTRPS